MHASSTAVWPGGAAAVVTCALALLAGAPPVPAQQPAAAAPVPQRAGTLDRIRDQGRIRLGYRTDAGPFSYKDDAGRPAGYAVALCNRIADATKQELGLGQLAVEWVPVTANDRFQAVQRGEIDVQCGADTVTLARRAAVSFSIPTFAGGVGAVVRADAPARLRQVLSGQGQVLQPVWRASAARVLHSRAFSTVAGTTTEAWLRDRIRTLQVIADVSPVDSYDTGLHNLLERKADALFGERAILLEAAKRHPSGRDLVVIDRLFTYEPLAIAFPRGDDALRLLIDRTLSRFYASGDLGNLYASFFGEPDETTLAFFRWNTLPE